MRAPLRLAVLGATGRMGTEIVRAAVRDRSFRLVAAVTAPGGPGRGEDPGIRAGTTAAGVRVTDRLREVLAANPDVAVDVTVAGAAARNVPALLRAGIPCVVGTTGFSAAQRRRIRRASQRSAVVMAPNLSVGANLLFRLARDAARLLGSAYDCEIVEAHHAAKRDAPSGTALRLADVVRGARRGGRFVFGRSGRDARRAHGEIGIHALRLGSVVGDHRVAFAGASEWIELRHTAQSREAFAQGALVAARFAAGARRGAHSMEEVLGIGASRVRPR